MKVAVIITGLPRTYKRTFDNFQRMLDSVQYDTYIFSWIEYYDEEVSRYYEPKKLILDNWGLVSQGFDQKLKFFMEQLKWNKSDGFAKGHFNLKTGLLAQWYGVKKAYSIIENKNEYDFIVRYRFDWNPLFIIDWADIEENHIDGIVYSGMKHHGVGEYRINDMFAIGTPSLMDEYTKLFDCLMSGKYDTGIEKNNCFIPEFILAYHLYQAGIKTYSKPKYFYRLER